jgi:hypothetical protein
MAEERPLEPFVKEDPEPGEIGDPRLVRLHHHWNGLASGEAPPISAIDPFGLNFILGWLMVIEPLDRGGDFRYRLYGTAIAATTGRDLTGAKVSDSFPLFAAWTIGVYRDVIARRRPVLTRHNPRRYVRIDRWERLILPYAGADGGVERLLVGAVIIGKPHPGAETRLPWPLKDGPFTE